MPSPGVKGLQQSVGPTAVKRATRTVTHSCGALAKHKSCDEQSKGTRGNGRQTRESGQSQAVHGRAESGSAAEQWAGSATDCFLKCESLIVSPLVVLDTSCLNPGCLHANS